VRAILGAGETPVILGGDHSLAMGSVAGAAAHAGGRIGLLWIDAHADLNTPETSPTGNVHGMPLATLLGRGDPMLLDIGGKSPVVLPRHAALLGVRDVDPGERALIRELGLAVYTMKELDERGTGTCIREALARVTKGTKGFHLSFDMDALDPEVAPGVGTPVPGGLTYREAHLACELVAETGKLLSLDVVEVNPILDERNRTADLAVQMILSARGKTIF
jgi:arginase